MTFGGQVMPAKTCLWRTCLITLFISLVLLIVGTILTTVGGYAKFRNNGSSDKQPSSRLDPIDSYNANTMGYSESLIDDLLPMSIAVNTTSSGIALMELVGFSKNSRTVTFIGDVQAVHSISPNPATSYVATSTGYYPMNLLNSTSPAESATIQISAPGLDAAIEMPLITLSRGRYLGPYSCKIPSGCPISSGKNYCVMTFGEGTEFNAPQYAVNGGQCANSQQCGHCSAKEVLECFAVVLRKSSTSPTRYHNPTSDDIRSCDNFSRSLKYNAVNTTPNLMTLTAMVVVESDPLFNANRFTSNRMSATTFEMQSSHIVDTTSIIKGKNANLFAPGVTLLVCGALLFAVSIPGVCCGRRRPVGGICCLEDSSDVIQQAPSTSRRPVHQPPMETPTLAYSLQPHVFEQYQSQPPIGFVVNSHNPQISSLPLFAPRVSVQNNLDNINNKVETLPPSFAEFQHSYQLHSPTTVVFSIDTVDFENLEKGVINL